MFRKESQLTTPRLFECFDNVLPENKIKELKNSNSWHYLFREHITRKIDESPFSVLYSTQGRPNAPIRILVAMFILKEGHGWSDSELFEQARYNILVMNALGLSNISDEVPVESTYYELRSKLYEHQITTGEDLIGKIFEQITKEQAEVFSVKADLIRMDSKLIGSNIANCSRLQLVINCIKEFYKSIKNEPEKLNKLSRTDLEELEYLSSKKSGQIVYTMKDEEKPLYLEELGWMLDRILKLYNEQDSDKYRIIKRVFEDQYKTNNEQIELKKGEELSAKCLQSVHDEEAGYREKRGTKVKGYNMNITETCNESGLNLVVGVEVEVANQSDTDFLKPGVEQAERIVGEVKEISADGAYNSKEGRDYIGEEKQLHLTGIQGKPGKYDLDKQEDGSLKVTDRETEEEYIATEYKPGKYKIAIDEKKTKYFKEEQIEQCMNRRRIEDMPAEIRNRRNNVEASIYQMAYHLRKDKARYRGKYKTKIWAEGRAMWMNVVRIKNYVVELCLNRDKMEIKYA